MGREFELKFRWDPALGEALLRDDPGDWRTTEMETTYFDTGDRSLSRRHITFRRRLENGRAVWTAKTPAPGGARGEWETRGEGPLEAARELEKLGCPAFVAEQIRRGVEPVCGARFTRRSKMTELASGTVEVSLDRGVLTGGGREIPLWELEVEQKTAGDADTRSFALVLARRYGLEPEPRSKFRRALDLAEGG